MMLLRDIALLWAVFHVFVITGFLFEPRFPFRKTLMLLLGFLLPIVGLNALLYLLIGPEQMGQVIFLTGSLPALLVFWCISRHRNGRVFFTFFLTNTTVFAAVLVTHIIDYYLVGDRLIFFFVCQMVFYPVLEYWIWTRGRTFYRHLLRTVQHGWECFSMVSLMFFVALFMMGSWPVAFYKKPGQVPLLLLVIATMLLVYLTFFQMLYVQQKGFYAMESEYRSSQREQLLMGELEAEQKFVFNARRYRHDMHHHGKVIYEYLEQNDIEAAKNYLQIYKDHLEQLTLQNYCEHPTINALLRITDRRCQTKNIIFTVEGNVPQQLPCSDPEISQVLGNLLENACEAAEKTKDGFIRISAEERNNVLYLELRNSVAGRVKFDGDVPRSSKTHGGIGIQSIYAVLGKYDGMMVCRQEGNTFLTRVILPL